MKSLYVGVDFDGTLVKHRYPEIGEPIEGALDTLHDLIDNGHKIILYTMRCGERLEQAVDFLESEGIELYGVNENKSQKYWTESVKIFCHVYIDDAALGCPLQNSEEEVRPYVDWEIIREMLFEKGLL